MARFAEALVILAVILIAADAGLTRLKRGSKSDSKEKKLRKHYKCYGDPDQIINHDPNEPCPDIAKLEDGKLIEKMAKKNKKGSGDKSGSKERNMVISEDKKWPKASDGYVYLPYKIDPTLPDEVKQVIAEAHIDIALETCVRFREKTQSDENYVFYTPLEGCWSYVGLNDIGRQNISLGDGCEYKSVAIHETLHSLGFLHEQSRYDRNNYIKVDWNHIDEENWNQFGVGSQDWYTTSGTEYECGSVMHYHKYAFSNDGKKTMDSKLKECRNMGNNMGMTMTDRRKLNILYSCSVF